MKIVVAHESIDTQGGVESYLHSAIGELRARGHQIALLYQRRSAGGSLLGTIADETVGVEEVGLDGALAQIRSWGPDICYSHNMGALDIDRALLREWAVVKMLHGFFGTCVSGLKMHRFPSEHACHRTFGPACLAMYFPRRCGQLSPRAMLEGYRWALDQRALFPRYRSIVVASRYMRDEVTRHGAPPDRTEVLSLFSTVRADGPRVGPQQDTVLFAGRMTTLKGGHVLVAAAARAGRKLGRAVRLVMAGEGPQKESWRQLASTLGVQAEFPNWVAPGDRARVYGAAALVAVPSLWPEPFGLTGLDAAALGIPAVAFNVGGIADWLTDGSNGRLVDPAAGEYGFADAVASVLDAPVAERERMGCHSLQVARRLSVAAHVDKLETILVNRASS